MGDSELSTNKLGPGLGGEGLGALDGGTDGAVDDELRKHTKGTGDTEEDGVEAHLVEAVVRQEHTRVSINIGPWVLGLAGLQVMVSANHTTVKTRRHTPPARYQGRCCTLERRA